jgi:hypothetical protein
MTNTSICTKGLGNWLAAHRGEAAGGWRLESRTVNHQCAWRIVEAPFPQAPNLVDLLGYDQRRSGGGGQAITFDCRQAHEAGDGQRRTTAMTYALINLKDGKFRGYNQCIAFMRHNSKRPFGKTLLGGPFQFPSTADIDTLVRGNFVVYAAPDTTQLKNPKALHRSRHPAVVSPQVEIFLQQLAAEESPERSETRGRCGAAENRDA